MVHIIMEMFIVIQKIIKTICLRILLHGLMGNMGNSSGRIY